MNNQSRIMNRVPSILNHESPSTTILVSSFSSSITTLFPQKCHPQQPICACFILNNHFVSLVILSIPNNHSTATEFHFYSQQPQHHKCISVSTLNDHLAYPVSFSTNHFVFSVSFATTAILEKKIQLHSHRSLDPFSPILNDQLAYSV